MHRNRPLIGISAYRLPADFSHWQGVESVLVPAGYADGVERAGGLPVLLPPVSEHPEDALEALHGLILVGGADVNPAVYGRPVHPQALAFSDDRDRAELALLQAALERDLPLLGICRGMQLLNIAAGGDLHQHIPEITPEPDTHKAGPGRWARHQVSVSSGCRLAALIGERAEVVSAHHQAPERIGDGLEVVAVADDGTVEALELPDRRLALGVLWHPEEDPVGGAPLFDELVARAREYAQTREVERL